MEQIKIKINADATLEYEVLGVKGHKCKDLTRLIDTIAGMNGIIETKTTGEYCEQATVDTTINQNQ